jgi:hypothetical protein
MCRLALVLTSFAYFRSEPEPNSMRPFFLIVAKALLIIAHYVKF